MTIKVAESISAAAAVDLAALPRNHWFTQLDFGNWVSPTHQVSALAENNDEKFALLKDWIAATVPGKTVLDLFCANGGFSMHAALQGARSVTGIDFSAERIDCATKSAAAAGLADRVRFLTGDMYELDRLIAGPFDVVFCFGGLYHVSDPIYILKQVRKATAQSMLLQTASILPDRMFGAAPIAKLIVRKDQSASGLTSLSGQTVVWGFTAECLRTMLSVAGFAIEAERRPQDTDRFPWLLARCRIT